jgi:hypothetical protein
MAGEFGPRPSSDLGGVQTEFFVHRYWPSSSVGTSPIAGAPLALALHLRSNLEYHIRQEDRRFNPRRGSSSLEIGMAPAPAQTGSGGGRAGKNWRAVSVNDGSFGRLANGT